MRPGDRIGDRYRVEAVIGCGGMSTIYRCADLRLDRDVAIKALSPAALLSPEHVTRVRREVRAISHIRSEHVVRLLDVGEIPDSGAPFLVMELLEGADLARVVSRRGALPSALACKCIMHACEALVEAHALGIVHRDLKPANLFLTEDRDGAPLVKVLDFGISRFQTRDGAGALTDPGTVLGTPAYMAPEQMEGAELLDGRTDIWALGTILYELLVGRPRCRGDSLPQFYVSVVRSPPPRPSRERQDVPRALDAIVARCLAADPARRYPNVGALARALASIVPEEQPRAARIAAAVALRAAPGAVLRPARGRGGFVASAAASLAFGVLLGFAALSSEPSPAATQAPALLIAAPTEAPPAAPGDAEAAPVLFAAPSPP